MPIPRKLQRNWVLKVFFCVEIPTIILGKALLQQKNIKSVMQKICMLMHFMLASCVKEPFPKWAGVITKMKFIMLMKSA